MPNAIKYTTGSETLALKKGNFYIGTGDVGKGPTSSTGYYNGITPPSGGYTIYLNKESGGPSIYTCANDTELVNLTNSIAGTSYTTANECLVYFAGQTDKVVLNRDYEGIVTDGLVLNLDAGFTPSYPRSGTTWYDVGGTNNGTLTNGPTFNSDNGGSIVFDGVDDYGQLSTSVLYDNSNQTFSSWVKVFQISNVSSTIIYDRRANGINGYFIGYGPDNKFICVFYYNSSNNSIIIRSQSAVTLDEWYNITVTFDVNSDMSLYVNGIIQSHSSILGRSWGTNYPPRLSFKNGAFASSTVPLDGTISSVQIYNRALTASEVLQNYNATKGRFGL